MRFLIDLGTLIQSISKIGQLKALQQLNIFVQLDKNIARIANFIFGIGNATSIRSVNLNTLLELITFYIVPVNTLSLFCLVNIDKYEAFFNNITNKIIQTQSLQFHPVIRRYEYTF